MQYSKGGKTRKTAELFKKAIFHMARTGEFDRIIKYEKNPFEKLRVRKYKAAIEYALQHQWDKRPISHIPLVHGAPAPVLRDALAIMVIIENKEAKENAQE